MSKFLVACLFTIDRLKMEGIRKMTYKLMKRVIQKDIKKNKLDVEGTKQKLDVFLMGDRITVEEYNELIEMVEQYGKGE